MHNFPPLQVFQVKQHTVAVSCVLLWLSKKTRNITQVLLSKPWIISKCSISGGGPCYLKLKGDKRGNRIIRNKKLRLLIHKQAFLGGENTMFWVLWGWG
jgi:hypothetical protein